MITRIYRWQIWTKNIDGTDVDIGRPMYLCFMTLLHSFGSRIRHIKKSIREEGGYGFSVHSFMDLGASTFASIELLFLSS